MSREIRHHNQTVFHELEVGDQVEFQRGIYSHWAVYIGNGEVVHLAGEEDDAINNVNGKHLFTIFGKTFKKAFVRIDSFWDVVGDSRANRNNSKDRKWTPYRPAEIVERALSKLGEVEYNALYNNCEHFVSWCRYNVMKSEQADSFKTGLFTGLAVVATAGLIAWLGGGNRNKQKNSRY